MEFSRLATPEGYRIEGYDSRTLFIRHVVTHDGCYKSERVARIHIYNDMPHVGYADWNVGVPVYNWNINELIVTLCTQHRMQIK